MEIVIRGRHMDVSPKFKEFADDKLARLEHFGVDIARIDVEVSKEGNPRLADRAIEVELTCRSGRKGPLLRAEAHAADKFSALEVACDTMAERLRRLADKRRSQRRRPARLVPTDASLEETDLGTVDAPAVESVDEIQDGIVIADGPLLVRLKTHETRPMTVLGALDAMEMVGHDFFFFFDSETSQPSVVYRRRGYDYGLIRLNVSADDGNID
jgi:ribosomal subunit interface protein